MGVVGRAAIKRSAALLNASTARESTSDVVPCLGHDLDNLAHVTEVLLVRLKALEDRLNAARLADHDVTAEVTVGGGGMDHTGFDLIATACSHNGWLAIDVEVQLSFQHQIGFVPGMGMGRLTDSTRGRELSNAVLPIGLLSGEAQGDGITKNVADLGLLLKQAENGYSTDASSASQLFSTRGVLLPTAD